MKRKILLIPLLLMATIITKAQSIGPATFNVTGGSVVIGSNEYDWSIGEMTMVSTFSSSSVVITQGVLQPYELTTGIVNTSVINGLLVFPNPASSVLNIRYTSSSSGTLTCRLFDMAGRMILTNTTDVIPGITASQLNVSDLAVAQYLLEVTVGHSEGTTETNAYKIQKLQ